MVAAVKQIVKVQRGGIIRIQSDQLRAGDEAEVIVLVSDSTNGNGRRSSRKPDKKYPVARMTKQTRGDIEWAKKIKAEGGANIPWAQIKAERGL